MSNITAVAKLMIEVQLANGTTLRLTKDEALELWAELDDVFSRLFPVEQAGEALERYEKDTPPSPPQIVPVYVPWQPWQTWQPYPMPLWSSTDYTLTCSNSAASVWVTPGGGQ